MDASLRHLSAPGRGEGLQEPSEERSPDTGLCLSGGQVPSGARRAWSWAFL